MDKNIIKFNKFMLKYNMEFIPRRDYEGNIYMYELYVDGEPSMLPDGYDQRIINSDDCNIEVT